jgi:hypothetical protein
MKLFTTHFSLAFCPPFRLRPKYNCLSQHYVLRLNLSSEAKFPTHTP